ncbi:MAG: RHS repeat-associated core domain-containing protein, partial [Planctomycetota bacterium]
AQDQWLFGPSNRFGYAGYVYLPEIGMYLARNRVYDPSMHRWIQRDPAGYVDGMSLYIYSMVNPYGFFDPFGLSGCPVNQWHHMLPQQFRDRFEALGLDIDKAKFGYYMPTGAHNELHNPKKGPGWNETMEKALGEWEKIAADGGEITDEFVEKELVNIIDKNENYKELLKQGAQARMDHRRWGNLKKRYSRYTEFKNARRAMQRKVGGVQKALDKSPRLARKAARAIPVVSAVFISADVASGKSFTLSAMDAAAPPFMDSETISDVTSAAQEGYNSLLGDGFFGGFRQDLRRNQGSRSGVADLANDLYPGSRNQDVRISGNRVP